MITPSRAALHQALVVTGTALVVGVLHLEQPFLAVLAAQLLAVVPCRNFSGLIQRVASAWAGALGAAALLTAFPQQPWLSLPAFAALAGAGTLFVAHRYGAAPATLFVMGLCGMFSTGIIFPVASLMTGIVHGFSLSIAALMAFFLRGLIDGPVAPPLIPHGWLVGISVSLSLVLACLTLPAQATVMTIATLTCVLSLPRSARAIGQKGGGGLLGVGLSLVYLTVISSLTNNFAVFLLSLGLVIAALEGMAVWRPTTAVVVRQAAAMFVVMATLLPRPLESLAAAGERMSAVLLGMSVAFAASLVDWAVSERLAEPTPNLKAP